MIGAIDKETIEVEGAANNLYQIANPAGYRASDNLKKETVKREEIISVL